MDRKIILSVLAAALMGILGILLLLSISPDQRAEIRLYPWDLTRDASGRTRVFDLTLGDSTLADARALLGEQGEINLFADPRGDYTVEVYFGNLYLANIRADWVLTLEVDPQRLADIYDRGLRVSTTGSGSRKVKLRPEDIQALSGAPIRSLTYLPWKSLEPRDIQGNFGAPAEIRSEDSGILHWLYPDKGMDIARDDEGRVVIQYLNSDDFEQAIAPLTAPMTAPTDPSSPGMR